jgi:hypothetical protein
MPSYNAYGLKVDMPPGRMVDFRSSGGHIHFGIGKISNAEAIKSVKALDAILGVACVAFFQGYDNPRRRELYGLPGEYRLPPHGLEYRPLSNAWLFHPVIMNMVFDLARKALVFGRKGLLKYWKCSEEETIRIIRDSDVEAAQNVLDANKDIMLGLIAAAYPYISNISTHANEVLFNAYKNGIDSIIVDASNIPGNWFMGEPGKVASWQFGNDYFNKVNYHIHDIENGVKIGSMGPKLIKPEPKVYVKTVERVMPKPAPQKIVTVTKFGGKFLKAPKKAIRKPLNVGLKLKSISKEKPIRF